MNEISGRRVTVVLAVLFAATFTLGTAELGVVGMLTLISGDLREPLSATGSLVSAYAVGLAVGGPVLAAVTTRFRRRPLLAVSLGSYLLVTALSVLSPGLATFAAARFVGGALHGLFVGVAFTVAVALVPPQRVGQAISAVIGGFAVSIAFGVPLGVLAGQAVGWRAAFLAMVFLGAVCLVAILLVVPHVATGGGAMASQLRHALAPRVLAVLGLAMLIFAGQYSTFTYITPYLSEVSDVPAAQISVFLLVYGVATAVGVFAGGRFAARAASRSVVISLLLVVVALAVLAAAGTASALVLVALAVGGVFGLGMVPSLQFRIVTLGGPGRDVAATLPASAINAGIALGALAGGTALDTAGTASVVPVGLVLCALALPVAWATGRLRPPPEPTRDADRPAATTTAP